MTRSTLVQVAGLRPLPGLRTPARIGHPRRRIDNILSIRIS